MMNPKGRWNDVNCKSQAYVICKNALIVHQNCLSLTKNTKFCTCQLPLSHLPSWVGVVVEAMVEVVVKVVAEVVAVVEVSVHDSPAQPSKQRQTSGSTHCP